MRALSLSEVKSKGNWSHLKNNSRTSRQANQNNTDCYKPWFTHTDDMSDSKLWVTQCVPLLSPKCSHTRVGVRTANCCMKVPDTTTTPWQHKLC